MPSVSLRALPWARSMTRNPHTIAKHLSSLATKVVVQDRVVDVERILEAMKPKLALRCPDAIRRALETTFESQHQLKPRAVQHMLDIYDSNCKTNNDVRLFSKALKEAAEDISSPIHIKGGPVSRVLSNITPNVMFGEIVMHTVGLELTGVHELTGRDAAVEVFHADKGLQDLTRFKDYLMMSCIEDRVGVPFEVMPWPAIKLFLTNDDCEELKKLTCLVEGDSLGYGLPILSVDEKGRDRLFYDQSLIMYNHPTVRLLVDVVKALEPYSLSFTLEPGDVVLTSNFFGLHRRADLRKSSIFDANNAYNARTMLRLDAVDPSVYGMHV